MPEKKTIKKARKKAREGKAPSTQAGEFVREEIHHVRKGKHGAASTKQAIAIGLSKARKAGVQLRPYAGKPAARSRRAGGRPSATRSRAISAALRRQPRKAASSTALSRQASRSATRRGPAARQRAAIRALRTKGKAGLRRAARKAAATRRKSA